VLSLIVNPYDTVKIYRTVKIGNTPPEHGVNGYRTRVDGENGYSLKFHHTVQEYGTLTQSLYCITVPVPVPVPWV